MKKNEITKIKVSEINDKYTFIAIVTTEEVRSEVQDLIRKGQGLPYAISVNALLKSDIGDTYCEQVRLFLIASGEQYASIEKSQISFEGPYIPFSFDLLDKQYKEWFIRNFCINENEVEIKKDISTQEESANNYTIVKYKNGHAFYLTDKKIWDTCIAYKRDNREVTITHLISGVNYSALLGSLVECKWEEIPVGYRVDAWHFSSGLQKLYKTPFIGDEINEQSNKSEEYKLLYEKCLKEYSELTKLFYEREQQLGTLKSERDKLISELNSHKVASLVKQHSTWVPATSQPNTSSWGYDIKTHPLIDKKDIQNNIQSNKKSNIMNLGNAIPNFKFGKLDSTFSYMIALSMAGIAFRRKANTQNGEQFVVFNKETKQLIEVGDMKFDVDFYQIPVQTLNEGDITLFDGAFYIVERQNADGSLSLINPTTGSRSNKLARTNIFNMYFYTKVVSMFDFMGGMFNQAGSPSQNNNLFGNINPMMFMMMGDKGGNSDISSMMEMMMMSQLSGGNNVFQFGAQNLPPKKTVTRKPVAKKATTKK